MKKLVEMKGTFYLELVIFFYTIGHIDGEFCYLCDEAKGKQIVMTHEIWEDIVGLSLERMMVNEKGLKDAGGNSIR